MFRFVRPTVLVLAGAALTLTACPADKTDEGDAKAEAEDVEDDEDRDEEAADAGKDGESTTAPRTECPEALEGKDAADRVITKDCGPVTIEGDYSVEGATLTLEAGAHLVVADGAKINVGYYKPSKLIVKGTAEDPVIIEAKGDDVAGVWKGLRLYKKANRSALTHLTIRHAGSDEDGALRVDAEDVKVTALTIEKAKKLGLRVVANGGFSLTASKVETDEGPAVRTTPTAADGIASDNTFGDDATVAIDGGKIAQDVTLHRLDAAWVLTEKVQVNGESGSMATLTIEGGNEIRLAPASTLDIGYYKAARLVAKGSADAPISFKPAAGKGPGSWKYVAIYGKGEGQLEHVVFANGGADEDKGMLFANGKAKLALDHATFEGAKVAVKLDGDDVELEKLSNTTFKQTSTPIFCAPLVFGGVAGGNVYEGDGESRIHLRSGKVEDDTTWSAQAVPVELDGDVNVDKEAKLVIEAGSRFIVEDGVKLNVGYYDRATLELAGTKEAPIVFQGLREVAGAWGPMTFHKKSRGNRIAHVELRHVTGDAAVVVKGEADLKVEELTCTACEGKTLSWACGAKVDATGVAGTAPPQGCK